MLITSGTESGFLHKLSGSGYVLPIIYVLTSVFVCLAASPLQACFSHTKCDTCAAKIQEHAGEVLRFVGGIGLFFSFTEVKSHPPLFFFLVYFSVHMHCRTEICPLPKKKQNAKFLKQL